MRSAPSELSAKLRAGCGVIVLGILLALATAVAVNELTLAKFVFMLGGFALIVPTLALKNPQAYWLFLLVMSLPFDITKSLSIGFFDSHALVKAYGEPMSATIGLDIYLTDIILAAMLLPWLANVCLKRSILYFPQTGYLFVLYFVWAFFVSLANASLLLLSMFELFRQALYFIFFVYVVNNVSTRVQLRSVVWAILIGFVIGAGSVIAFFERNIGTDTVAFAGLHDQPGPSGPTDTGKKNPKGFEPLAVESSDRGLGSISRQEEPQLKRSQGMFLHPAIPASLCGLILPIVLAYLIYSKTNRNRILFFLLYAWGFLALLLTFSRAGFIGFVAGTLIFIVVGGRTGFISRRLVALSGMTATLLALLSMPFLLIYLETRPDTFFMRFQMFGAGIKAYSAHPLLGVGLNNDTAAMKESRQELKEIGVPVPAGEPADSYYLAILMGVGPVGSLLFFAFFGRIVMIGLLSAREVAVDMKPLLVGMISGLGALATQSIADGPMAGHAVSGTLWLFVALIVAIRRCNPAEMRISGDWNFRSNAV